MVESSDAEADEVEEDEGGDEWDEWGERGAGSGCGRAAVLEWAGGEVGLVEVEEEGGANDDEGANEWCGCGCGWCEWVGVEWACEWVNDEDEGANVGVDMGGAARAPRGDGAGSGRESGREGEGRCGCTRGCGAARGMRRVSVRARDEDKGLSC